MAAGYLKQGAFAPGTADGATDQAYQLAGMDVNAYNAAGVEMTLEELLSQRAQQIQKQGGGTQTRTATSIQEINPQTSQQTLTGAMRQLLGREPTEEELSAFQTAIQSEAEANPQMTTTTTDALGNSSSRSSGGVDVGAFTEGYLGDGDLGEEANTFDVATTYYNAALQLLGVN